jgi:glycosyltransferase involved in cell wall biosynthesis
MKKSTVSIIIPSFNRAHLLPKVIPSYVQDNVCEIIIVDDLSTDNTEEVVEILKKKFPLIVYFKSKIKIRQTGAKNKGISIAKGDYCYFGDDDSILKEGSIESLVNTAKIYPKSIIAARHIYMKEDENLKHVLADLNVRKFESLTQVFDKNIVNIDLSIKFDKIIEIPFCTYCFLIPTINAKTNLFNEGFVKTCFREETDFVMQMCKKGLKVYLDSNALSIDLPRTISKGGIYTVNKLSRHLGEVYNEFIFYERNKEYLKKISSLNPNPFLRAIIHLSNKLLTFIKFNV